MTCHAGVPSGMPATISTSNGIILYYNPATGTYGAQQPSTYQTAGGTFAPGTAGASGRPTVASLDVIASHVDDCMLSKMGVTCGG